METEKLTINVTPVDLGTMDILISQGLFSTRADLIRTSIRRLLEQHDTLVQRTIARDSWTVGVEKLSAAVLERHKARRERIKVKLVGMLVLGKDVTPDLADEVIEELRVRGVLRADPVVLDRLKPKIDRVRG